MTYYHLSQPIQIGTMTLKNRIIMPAMHHLYTENGLPTERFTEYYRAKALGGAAMVVTGACRFDEYGAKASTMSLAEDSCVAPWKKFTDEMHAVSDCRFAVQLYHAGRYMKKEEVIADDEAIAPSAVYTPFTKETARAMTHEDIARVIQAFAHGARRAKEAGFDAVEVSASAGYLLSQFLSPLANVREDEYGGSFENRCRFPLEVISAVRQAVGADYPVILRLGGHDLVPGSAGSDEAAAFAVKAEHLVDMINLTGGWHESRVPQLTGEVPRGGLIHLAQAVKAAVSIPVAMANRLGDPKNAEKQLALGRCDIITMGRPLIADPELPNKIFSGRDSLVCRCVACNQGCLAGTFFEKPVRCLANPRTGNEYLPSPAAEKKENILIVGGGSAGCQAALSLREKGHSVTLWEKSTALGGQLRLTSQLPARGEFGELIAYFENALRSAGVTVVTGKTAEAEDILSGGFDRVILANGMLRKPCPVPVSPGAPRVWSVEEFFAEKPVLGKRVAVIGGSFVGLEIARAVIMDGSISPDRLFYLMRGGVEPHARLEEMLSRSDRQVALFEKGRIGAGYEAGIAWPVLADLSRFGAEIHKNTPVLEINEKGVVTENLVWPCDDVIAAAGLYPDNGLRDALEGKIPVTVIGNANRLGRAIDATAAGWECAR